MLKVRFSSCNKLLIPYFFVSCIEFSKYFTPFSFCRRIMIYLIDHMSVKVFTFKFVNRFKESLIFGL